MSVTSEMGAIWLFGLLLTVAFSSAAGSGSACQDIDHSACVAMSKQNLHICSDQVLSQTACPAFCKACPVTCYSCNTTTSDVSQCNTVTCAKGEMCLLKTVSGTGHADRYRMMCGPQSICSTNRKRNHLHSNVLGLGPRSTSIVLNCCDSDLCNSPPQPASSMKTTIPTTKTATTTTTTTTSAPTTRLTVNQTPVTHHPTRSCTRDIIIMLEDTLPIAPYFTPIKTVLANVITQLDIGHHKTRVGLGTFSESGTMRWNLDRYMDKESLLSAINHLWIQNWATTANNLVAVEFVLQRFSQGNRAAIPDDVIFITEGHKFGSLFFNYYRENAAINSLHQRSGNVISVALGSVNQKELNWIASDKNHYIYIPDYAYYQQNYQHIVSYILNTICK